MTNRRKFLVAASAAAGVRANAAAKLAIEGGEPVRQSALRADYWGTQFYDDKEKKELLDVLESKRPFRWYGPGKEPPMKVLTFEKEFAARMQTKYALAVPSGTAALIVDPLDVEAIANGLCRVACDPGLRQDLIIRGHAQARQFSWQRAASQTLDIYRGIWTHQSNT